MRFVDQVDIHLKAGDGGNGAVAFRREKHVDRGGPNGGDGGNGGSIIFLADPQLTTLLDFRYQQQYRAKNGENGRGSDQNGAASPDLILRTPVGTLLRDAKTGNLLCDLQEAGQIFIGAKGGRGGLGNMNFATSTRQTPRFAQDGTPGQELNLQLELKLLADVGLLGFPNAGKSTYVSRVSRARPKIADYPFTTLVPNLGMVQYKDSLSFVVADIPGLIEGASEGLGLGHQFLRHVERCRVLIHLVDMGQEEEGREPLKDLDILNKELAKYDAELAQKPQLVAANKMDLPMARERLKDFTARLKRRGLQVFPISTATGEGMPSLMDAVAGLLFDKGGPRAKAGVRQQARGEEPTVEKRAGSAKPAAKRAGKAKPAAKPAGSARPAAKRAGKTKPAAKPAGSARPAAKRAGKAKPAAKRSGATRGGAKRK